MKGIYILFTLIGSVSYSQSIEETISWINRNSKGKHNVLYIEKTNKIQLIKISVIPGVDEQAWFQEFNPKDVVTISTPTENTDWNDIVFTFKKGGKEVIYFSIYNNNKKRTRESKRILPGITADIMCNKEMILKYKKAYLNLFKKLGANVKDGDFF